MKTISIRIFPIMMAAIAVSCTKSDVSDDTANAGIPIFIDPATGSFNTKSLFEPDNFNTSGNAVKIYDKITVNGSTSMYIDGEEAVCNGTDWDFSQPKYWTKTGTHSFTAFASVNAADMTTAGTDATGTVQVTYNPANEELAVGPWTITSENQFDFIYAHHTRSMTESNPYRAVPLQMRHLLCALQFNIVNLIPNDEVHFNSFYLNGIYREGNAVITPAGTAGDSQARTTLGNNGGTAYEKTGESVPLRYNISHNIFSNTGKIGADGYALAWPHPKELFRDIKATLEYTVGRTATAKEINLTDTETNNWRAGYRYIYNLYLHDNKISFEVKVLPWVIDDVIIDG